MEKRAVINELKKLYSKIPPAKIEIFKEFILIIWLRNINGTKIEKKRFSSMFNNYAAGCTLYEWPDLLQEILLYMHINTNNKEPDYAHQIAINTKLGEVLTRFDRQEILQLIIKKIGMQLEDLNMIALFFSYHVFTQDNQLFGTCYDTNLELLRFFATFFRPPSEMAKYYIIKRMIDSDYKSGYESLLYFKEDMVPDVMSKADFFMEFEAYHGKSFDETLSRSLRYNLLREDEYTLRPKYLPDAIDNVTMEERIAANNN